MSLATVRSASVLLASVSAIAISLAGAGSLEPVSDPTITFTWSPQNNQALPGGATFTRASLKQEYNGADYVQLASGAIPQNSAAVVGGAQGFFPEPAATNLQDESTDYTDAAWTKQRITPTDLGASSIGLNEQSLDAETTTGSHRMFNDAAPATAHTTWAIVDAGSNGQYFAMRSNGNAATYAIFDLIGGTVTQSGASVTATTMIDLGGGFFYCAIHSTSTSSSSPTWGISNSATPGAADPSFTGANEIINMAHAQTEGTIFSTSPILTSGATGSRLADVLDTGIVITTEFSALLDVTLPQFIGTAGITITLLGPDATAEDILRVDDGFDIIMDDGGTPVIVGTASAGARIKIAYGRDGSGRSASLDGATAVTGDAPGAGHEGDNFQLGSANSVNQSRSIHHLTTLYNERKSDAELEALAA